MRGWLAGGVVTRTMALALKQAGADVVYASDSESALAGVPGLTIPAPNYLPLEWTLRRALQRGSKETLSRALINAQVDVALPTIGALKVKGLPTVGWIPDFQHLRLPELFSVEKRRNLTREFGALAARSARVLLSSRDAAKDFLHFFPENSGKARVVSFPSLFAFSPPASEAGNTRGKFYLPERFLLVINQFWRHKNHKTVAQALGMAKRLGKEIPLVMAGLPVDYRDPENSAMSETFQELAMGGVSGQCVFLGKVGRDDLVDLLRTATAVVQPSLFEGWNTTAQDAKALGCPVLASDLGVHREQCPEAAGFFPPDQPEQLARILAECWDRFPTRPDLASEEAALAREKEFARTYGEKLMAVCEECRR